jgi:anti-sigma-K factor RskA
MSLPRPTLRSVWGKPLAEIDADHRRMLAERLAREQNATPQSLGRYYGDALRPYTPTQQERFNAMKRETAVRRDYHFGTDTSERAKPPADLDDGRMVLAGLGVVLAAVALLVLALGLLYLRTR